MIVIIAIGESLVAIGLGARSTDLDMRVIAAALLGLVVATSFWLAYFDYFPMRAQQLLDERQGAARIALARDVYSYLHLPMVVGIVLFAFAIKVTLGQVGHELGTIPAFASKLSPSYRKPSLSAPARASTSSPSSRSGCASREPSAAAESLPRLPASLSSPPPERSAR